MPKVQVDRGKPRDSRPFVADSWREPKTTGDRVVLLIMMIVLALLVGFAVGFAVYLLMNLSGWLTKLIWEGIGERFHIPAFSLIACSLGGLIIGLWTHFSHNSIDELEVVMARFKQTGSYRLENPAATSVSFLLPLAFGGPVGFEAGLTGIITAACCWVRDKLKAAGLRVADITDVTIAASLSAIFHAPLAGLVAGYETSGDQTLTTEVGHVDDYNLRRGVKIVLYLAAALGAFGGIAAFSALFGAAAGMPRFDHIGAQGDEFAWSLLGLAAAYLLLLVFRASELGAERLARIIDFSPWGTVVKPLVAGVALGIVALALPLVLFPGEEQCDVLMETWLGTPALVLLATAVCKALATPFCIQMGWKGGDLFPCIFAGVACGYGLAAITGADPMLMVTVTTAAYLAGVTENPALAIGILILCFPLDGILVLVLSALVGAFLPVPKVLRKPKGAAKASGAKGGSRA